LKRCLNWEVLICDMLHLKSRFCDGIVYLSFRFDWCPRGRGAEGCGGRRRRTGGSPSAGGLLTTGFLINPPTKSKFRGPKKNTSQVWRVSPVRGKSGPRRSHPAPALKSRSLLDGRNRVWARGILQVGVSKKAKHRVSKKKQVPYFFGRISKNWGPN